MGKLSVLDCTLRDGGYCNGWNFGFKNAAAIAQRLSQAGIGIIECGFLTGRITYDRDCTRFTDISQISGIIPSDRNGRMFVCMVNYGEYDPADIPVCDGSSVDGIRVAFHRKDASEALGFCRAVKEKGYKVFIQAMASMTYSEDEFKGLIREVNALEPYAFYIVDSFGVMKRNDVLRLFRITEENLGGGIAIGFHSHNNLQLSYSNAQTLVDIPRRHDLIIDSSVFGMGRGAGNLNTELFVEYLNDNTGSRYILKPLLTVIDDFLADFYRQNYWGYSLPNYLSAKHNAHPNYAAYLDDKKTLTVEDMDEIFSMMDEEKKARMDRGYIEDLYTRYMETGKANGVHTDELRRRLQGRTVMIIAPGRSCVTEKEKVLERMDGETVTFGVNSDYAVKPADYIFVSNLRRFRSLDMSLRSKCVVTSNIPPDGVYLQTPYSDLLNGFDHVRDNSAMMLMKFLINMGVRKVLIAGLDGYSTDPTQNFADSRMNFYTAKATFEAMNEGLNACLRSFAGQIETEYVTTPKFIRI